MKNAHLGSIFIPEKYVLRVCFESPFTRIITSLKYKYPPQAFFLVDQFWLGIISIPRTECRQQAGEATYFTLRKNGSKIVLSEEPPKLPQRTKKVPKMKYRTKNSSKNAIENHFWFNKELLVHQISLNHF